MKKSIILGVFALAVLTFGACTKAKDGAPGAQGPEGNANVIGSNTVTTSNWTLNSGIMYYTTLTSSNITQAIVDKGVVLVYEGDGSGGYFALPYTFGIESSTFDFDLGFVNIYITNTDASTPANPGSRTYRIVTITSRAMIAHTDVDFKNYVSVKKAFNLKD